MLISLFQRVSHAVSSHCIRSLLSCLCFCLFLVNAHANTVLVLGDSLSAAFLIPVDSGWVKLLEQKAKSRFSSLSVINASISGDTTADGLQKLPSLLKQYHPTVVVVELGGNDGLRGLPIGEIEKNLTKIIELILKTKAKILLVGIQLPPNYGAAYTQEFANIYTRLSKHYHLPLVPFLLEGIALNKPLMFEDGIHPREQAQPLIVENVWPYLAPLL